MKSRICNSRRPVATGNRTNKEMEPEFRGRIVEHHVVNGLPLGVDVTICLRPRYQ